jgi:hypothetical protein
VGAQQRTAAFLVACKADRLAGRDRKQNSISNCIAHRSSSIHSAAMLLNQASQSSPPAPYVAPPSSRSPAFTSTAAAKREPTTGDAQQLKGIRPLISPPNAFAQSHVASAPVAPPAPVVPAPAVPSVPAPVVVPASSTSILPDDWQEDSTATQCHACSIKFSILTRKHHWYGEKTESVQHTEAGLAQQHQLVRF